MTVYYQIYLLQIFSPSLGLVFSFSSVIQVCNKYIILNFKKMSLFKEEYSGNDSQSGRNTAKTEGVYKELGFGQY